MPQLVSLARTPREKRDMVSKEPRPDLIDDFDYGLSVTLNDAAVRKLALGSKGLKTGEMLAVAGEAMVTNTSIEMENGVAVQTITIQFQSMAIMQKNPPTSAEKIYGGKVAKS